MKTHIIQLEQHDDLISVRDKMSWAKSERILLVWPPRRLVNIRPLDMVLLQRHAASLGSQLGIATRSGDIRQAASELGIPVFKTASEAQLDTWKIHHEPISSKTDRQRHTKSDLLELKNGFAPREAAWVKNPAARIGIFTTGVLSILILLILFVPSATIRLSPARHSQTATFPVIADPSAGAINISGIVPAYPVSVIVFGEGEIRATGKTTVPESQASGTARFTNLTQNEVEIPEGTILRTSSEPVVRFQVAESGTAPEGVGETVLLPIRAIKGGADGNLEEEMLQTIEGSLGLSLSVTNPDPTTGGDDAEKTTATEDDRSELRAEVEESLSAKAIVEIEKQMPSGGILIPNSMSATSVSEVYDPLVGSPGTMLSLGLTQEYRAYFMKKTDLEALSSLILDASLREGFMPLANTLSVKTTAEPLAEEVGKTTWQILADRDTIASIDRMDLISGILGKTPADARKILERLDMSAPPRITLSPPWWFLLPSIPMRIAVETTD